VFYDISIACWATCFATWAVGAVLTARYGPKAEAQTSSILRVSPLAVLALLAFLLSTLVPPGLWPTITLHNEALQAAGSVILVVSTLFTLWARWALGTMWSATPTPKEHHELRTDGPYRLTRHPIYSGILGMLVGSVLVLGSLAALLVLLLVAAGLLSRLHREEQILTDLFGDDYRRYQRDVPQLVPSACTYNSSAGTERVTA